MEASLTFFDRATQRLLERARRFDRTVMLTRRLLGHRDPSTRCRGSSCSRTCDHWRVACARRPRGSDNSLRRDRATVASDLIGSRKVETVLRLDARPPGNPEVMNVFEYTCSDCGPFKTIAVEDF